MAVPREVDILSRKALGAAGLLFISPVDPGSRLLMSYLSQSFTSVGFYYPSTVSGKNETFVTVVDFLLSTHNEYKCEDFLAAPKGSIFFRRLTCSPELPSIEKCLKKFRTAVASIINYLSSESPSGRCLTQSLITEKSDLLDIVDHVIELAGGPALFDDIKPLIELSPENAANNTLPGLCEIFCEEIRNNPGLLTDLLSKMNTKKTSNNRETADVTVPALTYKPLEKVFMEDIGSLKKICIQTLDCIEKGTTPIVDMNALITVYNKYQTNDALPLLQGSYAALITSKKKLPNNKIRVAISDNKDSKTTSCKEIILPANGADLSSFSRDQLREIAIFLNSHPLPEFEQLRQDVIMLLDL